MAPISLAAVNAICLERHYNDDTIDDFLFDATTHLLLCLADKDASTR